MNKSIEYMRANGGLMVFLLGFNGFTCLYAAWIDHNILSTITIIGLLAVAARALLKVPTREVEANVSDSAYEHLAGITRKEILIRPKDSWQKSLSGILGLVSIVLSLISLVIVFKTLPW